MSDAGLAVSCPKVRRRVIGSNVWLLSFGDLVTLLLGFFVAIIAYAMQHPPVPPKTPPQETVQPGTTLADIPAEDANPTVFRTVTVPEEAFDPVTGEVVEKWRNTLKARLNPDDIRIIEARVFGCVGASDGDLEKRRFAVMGRTLAVTGQVFDMGAPENVLQIETPGEVCESGVIPGAVLATVKGFQRR